MKELIIGTKNSGKLSQIQGALSNLDIKVIGLPDVNLPEAIEDGKTAQENGRKKALIYSKFLENPVLSMDNALYFNDLSDEEQPGIHVRRIKGRTDRPTDEEMLSYYSEIIKKLGNNEVRGYWEFAVCIAFPNGGTKETTIISERIFTSKVSDRKIEGYPLESMQIDPVSKKYISEMTQEEQDNFWKRMIGDKLGEFVENSL